MTQPRDHHFVPVFYLKRWTNADGKLIEFARPCRGKIVCKTVGPRATGFQRDLYSFPDCPKEIAQYLESHLLQRTDSLAADALKELLTDNETEWTPELRSAWSRFTINFLIRHPHPFAEVKAATRDNWLQPDDVTQEEYDQLRGPDDPESFHEWVLQQPDNLADRVRMRLLQSVLDNELLGTRLNNMTWEVLDLSASRFQLLTSDWPLIKVIDDNRILFALPISPFALFAASNDEQMIVNLRRKRSDELAREINVAVTSQARLYVYSTDLSQRRFVENRMSSAMIQPPFFPSLMRD